MKGELDDPRSVQYQFRRWNPFARRWEWWDHIADCWAPTFLMCHLDETVKLSSAYLELSYKDTWAEPVED